MGESPKATALEMVAARLRAQGIEFTEISFAIRSNVSVPFNGSTRCVFCRHSPNLFYRAAWRIPGQDGRKAKRHQVFCRDFVACDARQFKNSVKAEA